MLVCTCWHADGFFLLTLAGGEDLQHITFPLCCHFLCGKSKHSLLNPVNRKTEEGKEVIKTIHEFGSKIKLTENCVFIEMEIDYQNIQGQWDSAQKPKYFWYKIARCPATEMWFRVTFFMKGSMTRTFDRSLEENGYYASMNAILHKHIWKALDSRQPEAEILYK